MMRESLCFLACVAILLVGGAARADAQVLECTAATSIDNGTMVICWKKPIAARHLLIHFHGAPETVQQAFARSGLDAVLVVINFPGLSTAYSRPFATDHQLFQQILDRAATARADARHASETHWERITVSSFSAGYGAVREILKTPTYFDQIDALVAADSIYAGLRPEHSARQVEDAHMKDFLRFAALAAKGKKTFIISHSAQATPYASTTETADYLLRALDLTRVPETTVRTESIRPSSHASRGRFLVLGCEGDSGPDHMQHLRHIDLFWSRLTRVKEDPQRD